MKNALTLIEINQIIDDAEKYAKTECDNAYEQAASLYSKREHFKELIDDLFDKTSKAQINLMRAEMDNLFSHYATSSAPANYIADYIMACRENQELKMSNGFKMGGRSSGKTSEIAILIIVSACRSAFAKKFAEYIQDNS